MRQAVTLLFACLVIGFCRTASSLETGADQQAAIAQARRLIDASDHAAAATLLEDALIDGRDTDKPAIIELLRTAYRVMAKQADEAGQPIRAAHYRENLDILDRRRRARTAPTQSGEKPSTKVPPKALKGDSEHSEARPTPSPERLSPQALGRPTQQPPREPAALFEPAPVPEPSREEDANLKTRSPSLVASDPPSKRAPIRPTPGAPTGKGTSSAPPVADLQEADRHFAAKRYDDAGRCYAALAQAGRLPAARKEHWAYCRWVAVVRSINAAPHAAREWDQIEAEIQSIQLLCPQSWFGEYLRNKVAEVRRGGRRTLGQSGNVVIRGSAPEEPEPRRFPRLFGKERGAATAQQTGAATAQTAAPGSERPLALPGGGARPESENEQNPETVAGSGVNTSEPAPRGAPRADAELRRTGNDAAPSPETGWQVYETANFRVFHRDASLAEAAAQAAEATRTVQAKNWHSPYSDRPWSPPCELYLYPDGKTFAQATKQPENSPGFSTMISNGNHIVTRRMSLRADHPQLLASIVPHEVTHVVLADLFTTEQIPRWADEGLAVLAEPKRQQHLRWAELEEPLSAGRLFALSRLMAMDYPDAKDWSLYYAQSVSLTHFLVELDTPERFIHFVQDSHKRGIEAALRDNYRMRGFPELQERWLAHARKELATLTASNRQRDEISPTSGPR
jgi:hypothetical protein